MDVCHWERIELDGELVEVWLPVCWGGVQAPSSCYCRDYRAPVQVTVANLRAECLAWQERLAEAEAEGRRLRKLVGRQLRELAKLRRELRRLRRGGRGLPAPDLAP